MADDGAVDRERAQRARVEILDALVLGLDRRVEVLDLIAASTSADSARESIEALLEVTPMGASATLGLQARRFAQLEARRIRDERATLLDELSK